MAFNLQAFKTRAITAVIFVAVMLIGLLWNYWSFIILFSIIHFGCWIEYHKIVALIDPDYGQVSPVHKYGSMIAGWGIMLWITNGDINLFNIRLHEVGWILVLIFALVLPISEVLFSKTTSMKSIGYSLLGLLYISVSWALMLDIYQFQQTVTELSALPAWILPVVLIASIWINDTMAYIVGSLIGKTPLSPISPKKTWEGTIGGAVLSILVISLVGYYGLHIKLSVLIAISGIAAVIGTLGDLLESKLKRMAGVKDSGHLMPGHGGFLDRFDSLVLATPIVWFYLEYLY